MGTYYVRFFLVNPSFFTTNATSARMTPLDRDMVTEYQSMLLDGKYLDRTVWDNVTRAECIARYNAPFITSGHGFGVPTWRWENATNLTEVHWIGYHDRGDGDLGIEGILDDLLESVSNSTSVASLDFSLERKIPKVEYDCRFSHVTTVSIGDHTVLTVVYRLPEPEVTRALQAPVQPNTLVRCHFVQCYKDWVDGLYTVAMESRNYCHDW